MSTALGLGVYPLVRDELSKISKMSGFHHHGGSSHLRRPSASSATGSYTSHSSSNHNNNGPPILSTLEDSGNVNNRGLLQCSSSVNPLAYASNAERDSSTDVNTGGGTSNLPRGSSNGSLKQSRSTSPRTSTNNESYDANSDTGDRIVEEKRKRTNGDGYSIHRYTLGRLLGKGGFAKVYLCTAMDTGKNYAVKVVPKANLVKARAQQKLQAEIKIHRNLKHRHVCLFKHYFEDRTNCYILLELCHNQSLNEMIKRRKRITEPEAAYFMKQLLEAVQYMHDENVIHRDLKLGNLFLDKDMCIKVGDLGLATKVEDKDEKRKTICGTPNYIAPEIIQGDKSKRGHSFEVDVWSMGVILYTILIGKPPYEAKDVKATYQRILNNEYSFPRHIEVSHSAKSLIKSMLQSHPSDRPTLYEISVHPFLVDGPVPTVLPTSVLSIAPVWRINDYGEVIVCTDKATDYSYNKKPALPRSSSSITGRRPFASHNPNKAASTTTSGPRRGDINMERVVKTAVAAMSSAKPSSDSRSGGRTAPVTTTPAFAIFEDESSSTTRKSPPTVSSRDDFTTREEWESSSGARTRPTLTEEALCQQTRALSLNVPVARAYSGGGASSSSVPSITTGSAFSGTDNDAEVFKLIVEHLGTVLTIVESRKGSYRSTSVRSLLSRHGPSVWVTRYVDYTCKYGLGFLLNDGCSGVYFNDSTKTVLESKGDMFQYIERKRNEEDCDQPRRRGETTVETHTLENYPESSLKKKVTLLKHFRNYLLQQQVHEEEDLPMSPTQQRRDVSSDLVYVKKWVRTKHAILFSLSNRTIQVIFYDQTEILLTPDIAFLTYVDRHRKRFTYHFTDELVGASPEIEKRLRYAKDIMLQLLGQTTNNNNK